MKIKWDQHKSNKWWETTWQKVVFSLWGDTEGGEEEQEALQSPPFSCLCLFPSFSSHSIIISLFLHIPLSQFLLSLPLSHPYIFLPPFSLSQNMKSCMSSQPELKKRKKRKNFLSNNSDALLNLINEAWETWSYNTLVSIKEHKGDWLLPDAAGCLGTKRTHTCNPFGFGATLSVQWVPTELSLSMTDCTLTSQGVEERYSLFMKSKMENPFTQADS